MSTQPGSGSRTQEIARLRGELERIIWHLAELEASDVATVPVALPMALAPYRQEQARALDVPLSDIMVSSRAPGAYHTAQEAGEAESAQEVAAIIRRLSAPDVGQRFVDRHRGGAAMSTTIQERDMLKTAVPERDRRVTTYLRPGHSLSAGPARCPPWTVVWQDPSCHAVWLHFWRGPTTPGGLAEAHAHVVEQVQRGAIPAQGQRALVAP